MSDMRQRTVPNSSSGSESSSDAQAKITSKNVETIPEKRGNSGDRHDHDSDEEHDHDHPIDEEKLDNLLWEISKFCIPVGFFLYLSIYLCYRHELHKWFSRSPTPLDPSRPHSYSHKPYSTNTPILASGVFATVDASAPSAIVNEGKENGKFDSWVKREEGVAWKAMAANIGPEAGAGDGIVVGASSRGEWEDEPDYHFTWTRDAALIISTFLPRFIPSKYLKPWLPVSDVRSEDDDDWEPDYLVEPLIRAYVSAQADLQTVKNPSGSLWDGGLNEPKFHVDGTAFTGSWGRPQRDGPALRALSLIPYALFLLDRAYSADITYVRENLYDSSKLREAGKVIKNDLEEVGGGWWRPGFDLWEEVDGHHLFTLLVSLRSLQSGAVLASKLNDTGASKFYLSQADKITHRLADFWDAEQNYYLATLPDFPIQSSADEVAQARIGSFARKERTGLDCAIPLAIIHAGDEDGEFSAGNERVLSTLREYVRSFEGLYAVNKGREWVEGWVVGRYKEDVYNGIGTSEGNPWFLCTFAVAEMFYAARTAFEREGSIEISNMTVPFWSDILDLDITPGTITKPDSALARLKEVGDAFFDVGSEWVPEDGRMSEQINRWDGSPVGARDLTWSYSSFITALRARRM